MATQFSRSTVSETSICNQALSWLGEKSITSLDDPSTVAELCRQNYPHLRDAVLEERNWTFATVRASSTTSDLDGWGQMYKHSLPNDWLQVFRVYRDVSSSEYPIKSQNWRREGRFILSDDATIYMWGIQRVTDTGFFSLMFVQALAARMAADLAIPLTGNTKLQADMWALYGTKLAEAAVRDGQQGANEQIRSDSLVNIRHQGRFQ